MFGKLWQTLFGGAASDSASRNRIPPSAVISEPEDPPTFLVREPLLDALQRVAGYRFAIRRPAGHWDDTSERFFDRALVDHLLAQNIARLTGNRPFLISLRAESLRLEQLDRLAASHPILQLAAPEEASHDWPAALLARARTQIDLGARLACSPDQLTSPLADYRTASDMIVIAADRLAPPDLLATVRQLRQSHPGTPLLAAGVDSIELFDACRQMHFDFYQGGYLTARREGGDEKLSSQRIVVSQLIGHLRRKDTDYDRLVSIARQDIALTFRLLRYINSAAMGLRTKIGSLKQAMVYIGREGLYRWLTLLLFSSGKSAPGDEALRETSLGRARMCELLAQRRMSQAACEQAFVTGLLSLVDVLFRQPMEKALDQLDLPTEIHEALARQEGPYGPLLALTLACEQGDTEKVERLAAPFGLDREQANALYLNAQAWALEYDLGLDRETEA